MRIEKLSVERLEYATVFPLPLMPILATLVKVAVVLVMSLVNVNAIKTVHHRAVHVQSHVTVIATEIVIVTVIGIGVADHDPVQGTDIGIDGIDREIVIVTAVIADRDQGLGSEGNFFQSFFLSWLNGVNFSLLVLT